MAQARLVLASTSPFRAALLERLGMPFLRADPQVDETPLPQESPQALVMRLAEAKARAVAPAYPDALIIGSDQMAWIDGQILGKPGNRENTIAQLLQLSGKVVTFYTGLCLFHSSTGKAQVHCEPFQVQFRALSQLQIERYVDRERPFQCAGGFKSEGLGITLFESLKGEDPNALIGLPLIRLVSMLQLEGIDPLTADPAGAA